MKRRKKHKVRFKKRRPRLVKFVLFAAIMIALLFLALNFLVSTMFGVSVVTLANDALAVTGITTPTLEEIKTMPVEEVNQNVHEFIEEFNKASEAPEPIKLEEGLTGIRVMKNGVVVEEVTLEVENGEIISINYSGLPEGVDEEDIAEMPEEIFRLILSGEIPKSLPAVLESYSKGQGN